jgi:phospholipid/cholesterol/gamma-HCH transport system ATP-binding protein
LNSNLANAGSSSRTTLPVANVQQSANGDAAPVVNVENVCKAFGPQHVLNGVSLTVNPGETRAVLGRSGTGKSVLLRLIVGLQGPDSGIVKVFGQNITALSIDQLAPIRKKMGFLFQHAALYDSLNVAENVAFPLRHHRADLTRNQQDDRVRQVLAEVGMENQAAKMPSDLSGGMQKRIGLARALVLDPELLLLDEPTAGLDPMGSAEINDLVLKLQKEHHMAFIVVTHDMHSARTIANRLTLLNKGCVVIDGSFEELQESSIEFVRDFLKHS